MNISKMRVGVGEETQKVIKMVKQVGEQKEMLYDFRKYLIKDGVLQPGCHIVREKIEPPTNSTTPIASYGYIVGYDEMVASGELIHDADMGALKVIIPKLNVGNDVYPLCMQDLFIYSDEGVGNEAYKENNIHFVADYYSECTDTTKQILVELNVSYEHPDGYTCTVDTDINYDLYSMRMAYEYLTKDADNLTYGIRISFNGATGIADVHGTEILYIKDAYIVA